MSLCVYRSVHTYTHIYVDVRICERLLLEDDKCLVQCNIPPFTCKDAAIAPPLPQSKVFGFSEGGDGRGDSSTLATPRSPADS